MEKETITLNDFNLNMILSTVFNWAYENDLDLFKNLDNSFSHFHCRNAVSEEEAKLIRHSNVLEKHSIKDLLARAISLADYQDTLNFNFAFVINNHSTNKGHGSYDWKYSRHNPHPYSELIPLIENQLNQLREKGLDDWHKSTDHKKHHHFRYWINHFLTEDKHFSLRFFIQHTGNTRCFDTLHVGSNSNELFGIVMQYILENNIIPDPHHKKLEVPDFVNPDNYNERCITSSGRFGGFRYLVYLTGDEMKDIYKNKINKRKLSYLEKAFWGYVNATSKDKETKFYLFVN